MTSKRSLLPRRTLRDRDNASGAYPRSLKTGDVRTGQIASFFDDLNTQMFVTNVTVSMPTSLQLTSSQLAADLDAGSTHVVGRVNKGVTEAWMLTAGTHDSYQPFKESGLHEQDLSKYSTTWRTGSSVSELGLGFAATLGEKTKLRFEFPLRTRTVMDPLTASAYYFNAIKGGFDEVAPSEKTDPNPNNNVEVRSWSNGALQMDVKYFDPLGNYAVSGTNYRNILNYFSSSSGNPNRQYYIDEFTNTGVSSMLVDDRLSVLRSPTYAATSSQYIDMSQYITSPFLLEKVTVELPFEAGPGWFNDRTRMAATLGGTQPGNALGVGGPCVTFAICNQISTTEREIILSASIIPEGDNSCATIHSTLLQNSANYLYRTATGFPSFNGKPTVVVPSGSNSMFTGTLRFDSRARISNGIVYADLLFQDTNLYPLYTPATAPAITYPTNLGGYILFVNPFGRGGDGIASGRSIFGRENITPKRTLTQWLQITGTKLDVTASGVTGSTIDLLYKNGQGGAVSPYLLMPTDKLVMVVSKYHSAPLETSATSSQYYYPLSQSHDVKIGAGTMRITMYGSHVSDQSEYHDTLNTDITSKAVHSIIGLDPIVDQWNVENRPTYSGSYTDNIITGSQPVIVSGYPVARHVMGSKSSVTSSIRESVMRSDRTKRTYELAGTNLTAQLTSRNERYWDTLLPGIEDIASTNLARSWLLFNSQPGLVTIGLDKNGPMPVEPDSTRRYDGDFQFSKNFPFAPAYISLSRRALQGKRVKAYWSVPAGSFDPTVTDDKLFGDSVTFRNAFGYLSDHDTTQYNGAVPIFQPPNISDAIKMYFGFGDLNTMQPPANAATRYPDVAYGTTNGPSWRYTDSGQVNTGLGWDAVMAPEIRGWKYGILNGLETYSRCHFRRDHYGQLRDMLEQRLFGTFYETVGFRDDGTLGGVTGKLASPVRIRFIGSDGTQVEPETTISSNLSNEATSSLPFFDGEVRNRGSIDSSKIGSSLVAPFVIS